MGEVEERDGAAAGLDRRCLVNPKNVARDADCGDASHEVEIAILDLVATRPTNATVCPSEVARKLATASACDGSGTDWRLAMPRVHAAVDRLLREGSLRISWKGKPLAARSGPYRIRRG